jgi:hypothetical protein
MLLVNNINNLQSSGLYKDIKNSKTHMSPLLKTETAHTPREGIQLMFTLVVSKTTEPH